MININVATLWTGKVGVRDKYIDEALAKGVGLRITVKGEVMTIPADKVKMSLLFKSSRTFADKFSDKEHYLYYLKWKKDGAPVLPKPVEPKQESLL